MLIFLIFDCEKMLREWIKTHWNWFELWSSESAHLLLLLLRIDKLSLGLLHLLHLHLLHLLLVHHHLLRLHLLSSATHVRIVAVHHLLLRSWHDCASEWIDVLRAHEVVLNYVVIEGWHATILNEVLHSEEIETLLLKPLQELLLLLRPVVHLVHGLVAAQRASLTELLL